MEMAAVGKLVFVSSSVCFGFILLLCLAQGLGLLAQGLVF